MGLSIWWWVQAFRHSTHPFSLQGYDLSTHGLHSGECGRLPFASLKHCNTFLELVFVLLAALWDVDGQRGWGQAIPATLIQWFCYWTDRLLHGGSEHHGYHSEQANSGLWALWEYCRLCSVFKHYTQLLYTIWADSYCPIANFCDKTGQIVILEVTFDGHWYTGLW